MRVCVRMRSDDMSCGYGRGHVSRWNMLDLSASSIVYSSAQPIISVHESQYVQTHKSLPSFLASLLPCFLASLLHHIMTSPVHDHNIHLTSVLLIIPVR